MHKRKCKGPFQALIPVILASGSPRRKELLKGLGIDFEVIVTNEKELGEESGLLPQDLVIENARLKARAISQKRPSDLVIGADTCVYVDGKILGKPQDEREAHYMLNLLSKRWHTVFTGVCCCCLERGIERDTVVETRVFLDAFDDEILKAYIDTGEPFDKAGGYAVQAVGGFMIRKIEGSHTNVIGFPMSEVIDILLEIGAIKPCAKD